MKSLPFLLSLLAIIGAFLTGTKRLRERFEILDRTTPWLEGALIAISIASFITLVINGGSTTNVSTHSNELVNITVPVLLAALSAFGAFFGRSRERDYPRIHALWRWFGLTSLLLMLSIAVLFCKDAFLVEEIPEPPAVQAPNDPNPAGAATRTETRKREASFTRINDHCARQVREIWKVPADEGWRIDPVTIQVQVRQSKKSNFVGIGNRGAESFELVGDVANSGRCFGPFRDARGMLSVTATYDEVREVRELAPRTRRATFHYVNQDCSARRDTTWRVMPDRGWTIDVNSVREVDVLLSDGATYSGATNTGVGFEATIQIPNRGSCLSAFGGILARDIRGGATVVLEYVELPSDGD